VVVILIGVDFLAIVVGIGGLLAGDLLVAIRLERGLVLARVARLVAGFAAQGVSITN
jgi:hypothetical protein